MLYSLHRPVHFNKGSFDCCEQYRSTYNFFIGAVTLWESDGYKWNETVGASVHTTHPFVHMTYKFLWNGGSFFLILGMSKRAVEIFSLLGYCAPSLCVYCPFWDHVVALSPIVRCLRKNSVSGIWPIKKRPLHGHESWGNTHWRITISQKNADANCIVGWGGGCVCVYSEGEIAVVFFIDRSAAVLIILVPTMGATVTSMLNP
jgi:hypothetical protein